MKDLKKVDLDNLQLGIECLGSSSSMADIEVISLGYDFLYKLGVIDKITLTINTLGDFESRQKYRDALINYLKDLKQNYLKIV